MRRLLVVGSTVVFLDAVFYAAITPLLPDYVDDLGLSKGAAGVLSSAYAAGTLVASLPAGFMAARLGPRRTLVSGLLRLPQSQSSPGCFQLTATDPLALRLATRLLGEPGGRPSKR